MTLTIGQLAKAAGVPSSTVRYYERIVLLEPESRSMGNYRLYGTIAMERLRFIRAAQAVGFGLDDISTLLNGAACRDVECLIERRLADVARRLRDLRHVQRVLASCLEECRSARNKECPIVVKLKRS
ncbi:MAG: MerR family transcriptional regulator [Planctomycetia bacterium]|nr:MerR family transcriptional regulator [Planctomycetia bacterium]